MRLGTIADGSADGRLVVLSSDNARFAPARSAPTLQAALDDWDRISPELRAEARQLADREGSPASQASFLAPLPRAWQWLDGSVYQNHLDLMNRLFGRPPLKPEKPLMYQGMSHAFLGGSDDVPLPAEEDGIDFEGEFGVITGPVAMGTPPEEAAKSILLIVQINDWSLRGFAGAEMATGFGWIHAKPASSMAPFALTPDELGGAWRDGAVALPLEVQFNGAPFGRVDGSRMGFGFPELVSHAARTRSLCAGTVIGSGTVSSPDYRTVGSTCIAERRAIETLDSGVPTTGFMRFGERVRMEARGLDGTPLFGAIDQRVVKA